MKTKSILGVPCSLRSATMRAAVEQVLQQIQQRQPKDFARLVPLVRDITLVPKRDIAAGVMGEWQRDNRYVDPDYLIAMGRGDEVGRGVLLLTDAPSDELSAIIAHEFGHVCTRDEDLQRRGDVDGEWASEFAADWYAYRWGYGRMIACNRKTRHLLHHGATPGQVFEVDDQRYRLSRNFVVHRIEQ